MLTLDIRNINRLQSLPLIGSLNTINSLISKTASIIFQHTSSALGFCDAWYQTLCGNPLITLLPESIYHLSRKSIHNSILQSQKLDEEKSAHLTTNIFISKTIIKITTCLTISFLFFRTITGLINLHKNSKNFLKFIYFIYQFYGSTELYKSLINSMKSNLNSLNAMKSTIEQAQSLNFDQMINDSENIEYSQDIKAIWFKNHIEELSDDQLNTALNRFFPITLTIYDLANILNENQFNRLVVPKIQTTINIANLLLQNIQNCSEEREAHNLFSQLNTLSKTILQIIHQINKTSKNITTLNPLLESANSCFAQLEPAPQAEEINSPRKSLLDLMFEKNHQFNQDDKAWFILLFHGLDISDMPRTNPNEFTQPPKHPIENMQEKLKTAGLETYQDLQKKGILNLDKQGCPPLESDLLGRVLYQYVTSSFRTLLPDILFREFIMRIERLAERFLLQTDFFTS